MAMTFTLISHLREQLTVVLQARAERIRREEEEKERRIIEVRHRGTVVSQRPAYTLYVGGGSTYKGDPSDTRIIPPMESYFPSRANREEEKRGRR